MWRRVKNREADDINKDGNRDSVSHSAKCHSDAGKSNGPSLQKPNMPIKSHITKHTYTYTHAHTHKRTARWPSTKTQMQTHRHTQAGICLEKRHTQTHTQMYIHRHRQIHTDTQRHTLKLTKVHIQIYTHTEICRFTHRHTETQKHSEKHTQIHTLDSKRYSLQYQFLTQGHETGTLLAFASVLVRPF